MASQGIHSQAVGLTYSVLEPHVILAAGVSGTLLSECLHMHKSVISKNFEPTPCPNHDSHLAFGEIRPRAKLHKDSLAGRTQARLVSPGKAVPRGPPSLSQHYSHGLCPYKRELIKKVRVRRAWAPGRTEDAGPCLWSKVPDKRLTNKALSQASGWPQGLGEEGRGGGEGLLPDLAMRTSGWKDLGTQATASRLGRDTGWDRLETLMGCEGHLAVPICPPLYPKSKGPGWVVCVFHVRINPICFIFFSVYFYMEPKSDPQRY